MGTEIKDLFTCRNCQWGDSCPAPHNQICEYYDSISDMENDIEERLFVNLQYIEFNEQWLEYSHEYASDEEDLIWL